MKARKKSKSSGKKETKVDMATTVAKTGEASAEMNASISEKDVTKAVEQLGGTDWDNVMKELLAVDIKPFELSFSDNGQTVNIDGLSGASVMETKTASAAIWRKLGELRTAGKIKAYPKVSTRIESK